MSIFSESYRKNVSVSAALSAMLYSEEKSGESDLAVKAQLAIQNLHQDMLMISQVHTQFSADTTEDDAIKELLRLATGKLEYDDSLMPDKAVLEVIEKHQVRLYPSKESVLERVKIIEQAFGIVNHALQRWAAV